MLNPMPTALEGWPMGERALENSTTIQAVVPPPRPIVLANNESPWGPSPAACRALLATADDLQSYPAISSLPLRERLAAAHGVSAAEICVGAGSTALIYQILLALQGAEPGEVWAPAHTFMVYGWAAANARLRYREVPSPHWVPDLDALASAVGPATRCVCLVNPNNPTGALIPEADLVRFLEQVPADLPVIVDEAYAEYVEGPAPNGVALRARFANLLILRTFSKAYGLAAARVGYVIADAARIEQIERRCPPFSVSAPGQAAALAALDDPRHLRHTLERTWAERRRLTEALQTRGLEVLPSQGNFLCVDFGPEAAALNIALAARGIELRGLANYQLPGHLRITVGRPEQNDALLAALDIVWPPRRTSVAGAQSRWRRPVPES